MSTNQKDKNAPGGVHAGHRQRMRERFAAGGLESFAPHEILELLLYYAIPYRDTNELAHRLLEHFGGSLARVMEASVESLMEVKGITFNTAVLIAMLLPTLREYHKDTQKERPILDQYSRAKTFLQQQFLGYSREAFLLICMDPKSRVIAVRQLGSGSQLNVQVSPRLVAEEAIRFGAVRVLFAHNHPGGSSRPSSEDVMYTARMGALLRTLEIKLDDHIIIGSTPEDVTSLNRENYIDEAFLVGIMPRQELGPYDAKN